MKPKTTIIYNPHLLDNLAGCNLVIDSTAIIDASRNDDFLALLRNLSQRDCTLITIPSVIYEILRYGRDAQKQASLRELISDLEILTTNGIEESALNGDCLRFVSIYANLALGNRKSENGKNAGPSFTDSLLCLTLYKYRRTNIRLLTKNYHDIPAKLFDREEIIAYDEGKQITTHAIYSLNKERMEQEMKKWGLDEI